MNNNVTFFTELAVSFLPFIGFAVLNSKVNTKQQIRYKQYILPLFAVMYSIACMLFQNQITILVMNLIESIISFFDSHNIVLPEEMINNLNSSQNMYLLMIYFCTAVLSIYVLIKRILTFIISKTTVDRYSLLGSVIELFYSYNETENRWIIKEHYGQACIYVKIAYYGSCFASGIAAFVSCYMYRNYMLNVPFYPVYAVLILGELAFYVDGLSEDELKTDINNEADKSRHIAMYPLLRKPLRTLFEDKLSAEGTTINNGGTTINAIEDVLISLEKEGGHVGKNYAEFVRKKIDAGLKPNLDYVRIGYDLASGKSLLFNTPFYDKLNPYLFYAINRQLLIGGKILIVLGRHGTEDDLKKWFDTGLKNLSNIPGIWNIAVLNGKKVNEDNLPDIGIISRSGVHDLDIHKNNIPFLRKVSFVFIVEPSRLITTAQIGLNLLIKCCGEEQSITFCSVDRNCDGLVDALSHILMTNITEVSATEYPHGMSSYMYWTADDDYLQHRILPGVSRYLGVGTELSMVALKNQVKTTTWYGGDSYPVLDARWIAKQYYYDLLDYAQLPTNQEIFDQSFKTSYNMCDERVSDYSYVSVEDDRNNLFETRRNFATIAEEQGFVNVISSEYMLREYMSDNTEVFTADAKAIPYITADYARTKRNSILSLCLLLCIDSVKEDVLLRQMVMLNIDTNDPINEIWKEICFIFGKQLISDKHGIPILEVLTKEGKTVRFEKNSTILYRREYCVDSGQFESVYTIADRDFSHIILDDLQNASYIAEQENKEFYIGTELKGHVYQKYLPGQFFTLNGKYYEMVSTTANNQILVRRASEHIDGRVAYRQVRNYTIYHLEDSMSMGAYKSVNNIDRTYQFADFSVETPGYWKLHAYNDFDNGDMVKVSGVPTREYHHKQILKFDFSKFGDKFTDSIRMTLTNLLNEVFVTLFAENQPFISAVTPGMYEAPLTYSLELVELVENAEKCIFIIEDSQLDIGLLVAVERNITRIFQIVTDYLQWNEELIQESLKIEEESEKKQVEPLDLYDGDEQVEKEKGFFTRLIDKIKNLFKRPKKNVEELPLSIENKDSLTAIAEIPDEEDSLSESEIEIAEVQSGSEPEGAFTEEFNIIEETESTAEEAVLEPEEVIAKETETIKETESSIDEESVVDTPEEIEDAVFSSESEAIEESGIDDDKEETMQH